MHLIKRSFSGFLALFVVGILFFPLFVGAQLNADISTVPLVFPPPCIKIGISSIDSCSPITDIQTYIVRLYQFAVGISAITAVGMIVYGAIIIVVKSENIAAKSEGKQIIQDALWGVLLLFASYILLNTINPELVKLKEPFEKELKSSTIMSTSQLSQLNFGSCGTSDKIKGPEGMGIYTNNNVTKNTAKFDPNNNCTYRKLLDLGGMEISDNTGEAQNYYREDKSIPGGSVLWTYPYFLKGSSASSSARCLVYAYRPPNDSTEKKASVTMIDLNYQVTPCILNPLSSSTILSLADGDQCKTTFLANPSSIPPTQCPGWIWGNDEKSVPSESSVASSTPENLESARAAMEKLSARSSVSFSSSGTCQPSSETSPNGIKADVLAKKEPLVCNPSCGCSRRGITVSPNLLDKLDQLAQKKAFSLNSLTGGPHEDGSSHYSGLAADVSPKDSSQNGYQYLKDNARAIFGSEGKILCEAYFTNDGLLSLKEIKSNDMPKYNVVQTDKNIYTINNSSNTATCKRSGENKFHCQNAWDADCSPSFFEPGNSGRHLHLQVKKW